MTKSSVPTLYLNGPVNVLPRSSVLRPDPDREDYDHLFHEMVLANCLFARLRLPLTSATVTLPGRSGLSHDVAWFSDLHPGMGASNDLIAQAFLGDAYPHIVQTMIGFATFASDHHSKNLAGYPSGLLGRALRRKAAPAEAPSYEFVRFQYLGSDAGGGLPRIVLTGPGVKTLIWTPPGAEKGPLERYVRQ